MDPPTNPSPPASLTEPADEPEVTSLVPDFNTKSPVAVAEESSEEMLTDPVEPDELEPLLIDTDPPAPDAELPPTIETEPPDDGP